MLKEDIKKILERQRYSIVGEHSAVQVCRWTKKSIIDGGECYKSQFYGIKSHRCCQMSCFLECQNQCLHCWRPIELKLNADREIDNPKEIIDGCIEAQRKLLCGCGGNEKTNKKKFMESQNPKHFAISLIGEGTLYPFLPDLIKELRKRKITSFLVTNGLLPEKIRELGKKGALPTQLYVSLLYPNEKIFRQITNNKEDSSWKKFNETLELLKNLKTRTVIRMTLINDLNTSEEHAKQYAGLIKKASPLFIELKGYMSIGFARERLGYKKMPFHKDIREFSEKLLKFLPGYNFLDEKVFSRVVLLGKERKRMRINDKEI